MDGGYGDDKLHGDSDNDSLIGGASNDSLWGGEGNDTFYFRLGDGQDTIYLTEENKKDIDVLRFASNILVGVVTTRQEGNNLVISHDITSDSVTIVDFFDKKYSNFKLNFRFSFAATGKWYNYGGLVDYQAKYKGGVQKINIGSDFYDTYTSKDEYFVFTGSNSRICGCEGSDTFYFTEGLGHNGLVLNGHDVENAKTDEIHFGPGIDPSSLKVWESVGNPSDWPISHPQDNTKTMEIEYGEQGDRITIFNIDNYQIQWAQFADAANTRVNLRDLLQLDSETGVGQLQNDARQVLFKENGNDVYTLGNGKGYYLLSAGNRKAPGKAAIITNFNPLEDRLLLLKSSYTALETQEPGPLSREYFSTVTSEAGGDPNLWAQTDRDYIIYNTTTGALIYDADGSGPGAAVHLAQLNKKTNLSASSIFVIDA